MAKKRKRKPDPPIRGGIQIEACYVGHQRDRQKIEGKKNKHAWPKGKANDWRENPENIPDEYWYAPALATDKSASKAEEKISRRVFKKVAAIREEALACGWLEEWLFTRRFWNRHPATSENIASLVVCLYDNDKIIEVTAEYITIQKDGFTSKFYAPREAVKLREYDRRVKAGESVFELTGRDCDKPLADTPEVVDPREKDVTSKDEEPKASVEDRFKKPEERKDKLNRRARKIADSSAVTKNEDEEASLF